MSHHLGIFDAERVGNAHSEALHESIHKYHGHISILNQPPSQQNTQTKHVTRLICIASFQLNLFLELDKQRIIVPTIIYGKEVVNRFEVLFHSKTDILNEQDVKIDNIHQ